jgi:hypothetical protein
MTGDMQMQSQHHSSQHRKNGAKPDKQSIFKGQTEKPAGRFTNWIHNRISS